MEHLPGYLGIKFVPTGCLERCQELVVSNTVVGITKIYAEAVGVFPPVNAPYCT